VGVGSFASSASRASRALIVAVMSGSIREKAVIVDPRAAIVAASTKTCARSGATGALAHGGRRTAPVLSDAQTVRATVLGIATTA
jgi:hypothetical protein